MAKMSVYSFDIGIRAVRRVPVVLLKSFLYERIEHVKTSLNIKISDFDSVFFYREGKF